MYVATEELRAAILTARAAALNAAVVGMQAENEQRLSLGRSVAYVYEHFDDAISGFGLHENDIILLTAHGETA